MSYVTKLSKNLLIFMVTDTRYKLSFILKKTVTYWGIQNRGIKYKLKTLVQKLENTRC